MCLIEAATHRLPSAAQASVWSSFHKLRCSRHIVEQWNSFVTSNIAPEESEASHLGIQMLMDRMMKLLIKSQVEEASERSSMTSCQPINEMESNAIRYMAGYVAVKLLKKYRKAAKHPRLQLK